MPALILALCCLAVMPDPINAQTPQPATPEAAAQALFTALAEGRWLDAARLVHPEVLVRFREQKLMELRNIREPKPMTAADYRRHEPDMPEAVAEYMAKQHNKSREMSGSIVKHQFAGVSSVADLEKLSTEEMMARWFQAQDPCYKTERAAAQSGLDLAPQDMAQMEGHVERTIIGTASGQQAGGDSVAYVVYRTAWLHDKERAPHMSPSVLMARRTRDGWRIDPTESGGEGLFGPHFDVIFSAVDERDEVKRVVTWPPRGTAQGRAYLTGYGEDPMKSPPKALVIEQLGNEQRPAQRVEVPAAVFEEIADLLMRWGWMAQEP